MQAAPSALEFPVQSTRPRLGRRRATREGTTDSFKKPDQGRGEDEAGNYMLKRIMIDCGCGPVAVTPNLHQRGPKMTTRRKLLAAAAFATVVTAQISFPSVTHAWQ